MNPEPGTCNRRVLIVDDEPAVLEALGDTLAWESYTVVKETNPLQALERLRTEAFAVIISDQRMPELSGLEFLMHARALQPNASRILITAVLSLDTVIAAINKGEIYRFVVKPWLREEFLITVRDAAQRHDLLSHNASLQAQTLAMNRQLQTQVAQAREQNAELSRLNGVLETNAGRSLDLCRQTLEAFMPSLGSQARRVHHLCRSMGHILQLSSDDQETLETAARLHDIGLIGVPRSLIRKWQADPSGLSSGEQELIRQHPISGQELVRLAVPAETVALLVRHHHEHFNGTGYPDGILGEDIPFLARLLSVAVGFCELNDQPGVAAETIRQQAGAAYDPDAVRAFSRALAHSSVPRKERQLLASELRPGMLLSQGIYTMAGELLIAEGQSLTAQGIQTVLDHERQAKLQPALLVYC